MEHFMWYNIYINSEVDKIFEFIWKKISRVNFSTSSDDRRLRGGRIGLEVRKKLTTGEIFAQYNYFYIFLS